MIIERTRSAVGIWVFRKHQHSDLNPTFAGLRSAITSCQVAAEVLEAHGLLRPSAVLLRPIHILDPIVELENLPLSITLPAESGAREIVGCCEDILARLEQRGGPSYYGFVEVNGTGLVLDPDGQAHEESDVTWVEGLNGPNLDVNVYTQSDAWLPFTLNVEPCAQSEIYSRNAPRLEATLHDLERCLDLPLSAMSTIFSVPVDGGYRLTNVVDERGQVRQRRGQDRSQTKDTPEEFAQWAAQVRMEPIELTEPPLEVTRELLRMLVAHDTITDEELERDLAYLPMGDLQRYLDGIEGVLAVPPSTDDLVWLIEIDGNQCLSPTTEDAALPYLHDMGERLRREIEKRKEQSWPWPR